MSADYIKKEKEGAKPLQFWTNFKENHPNTAQFLVFFLLSNGVTVLQIVLMPLLRSWFADTALIFTDFQIWQVGQSVDGSAYYIFDYPAGALADGGGGGLAYFLAVQISIAVAQIINFFAQRNITFKSNTNPWVAAFWYVIAYILITIGAAAAQGFYKAPIYDLFMNTWGLGQTGETLADIITMVINAAISFWVFYPIFKIIFKQVPEETKER
ncbi:hypothetical protein HMI01_02720 [Halolactibacillus miurensis]|uniref:Putative flippase GtrA (Transmembrane translocase of bactoprenol-linked glucose) n=1 Tax=Halolactibacillus miurensis TaxID=306541 RepID=A0A1I6Q589_9BACI|nr:MULTISPECIES: hypothetical protein [Halolactibacillus]GEM03284.1 hypothetical protein HMI01_02720 [Halolactibacillus miurensis]SFS47518.1 Putative flippase GtrA (transmembrane translocase of bactoprenol-linked glucose) [Halolactibacillus miurensis]